MVQDRRRLIQIHLYTCEYEYEIEYVNSVWCPPQHLAHSLTVLKYFCPYYTTQKGISRYLINKCGFHKILPKRESWENMMND
jgi:hypothetical protein